MKKGNKKETQEVNSDIIYEGNDAKENTQNKVEESDEINKTEKISEKENTTENKDERTELLYKIAELNDKYLRIYSEFDNYRKRTIKEKNELGKFANAELITELLPVIDDFERALKIIQKNTETEPIILGVELIYNKLFKVLTFQGLKPIKSIGEPFNTDFHEAITNIPTDIEEMKGKVYDEVQKGYELNEKVIRFAKVVVAE